MELIPLYFIILLPWLTFSSMNIYHMDEVCGEAYDLAAVQSALVDTSLSLTYKDNMNCTLSFKAPQGKKLFLQIRRFATEFADNRCYDYLLLYEGSSTASPLLTKLCGEINSPPKYKTSSEYVTLHFVSDGTAKDRGFSIFILAYRDIQEGSCREDEIQCNSDRFCIDQASTQCDNINQCSDRQDEILCNGTSDASDSKAINTALVVGLSVAGIGILAFVIYVSHRCYENYKWNQFLKHLKENKEVFAEQRAMEYPLTHHYTTDEYINKVKAGKEAEKLDPNHRAQNNNIDQEMPRITEEDINVLNSSYQAVKSSNTPDAKPWKRGDESIPMEYPDSWSDLEENFGCYDNPVMLGGCDKITEL